MRCVRVESFEQWRQSARTLVAERVAPHEVDWLQPSQGSLPIGVAPGGGAMPGAGAAPPSGPASASGPAAMLEAASTADRPGPRVPRAVLERMRLAALHRDPARWALLYRVLWRIAHGEPQAASEADPDGARLSQMAGQVRREVHRMHALVRFAEPPERGQGSSFAWFEPEHAVLEEAAPHFVDRLGARPFVIATPDGCAHWDGRMLRIEAGDGRPPASPAAGDATWEAYYRSTFDPSRTNPGLLARQLPRRYWRLLPEARLIPGLLDGARRGERPDSRAPLSSGRRGAVLPAPRAFGEAARPAGSTGAAVASPPAGATGVSPSSTGASPPAGLPGASLQSCRGCPLWERATQAVPGEGPSAARLMLVGEQPGDEEDLRGRPFVGPAGRLLDRAIAAAGLQRERLYLTNAVKHFKWEPRGRRRLHKTPGEREIEACGGWLREELAAVAAPVVVSLGATALAALHRAAGLPAPSGPLGEHAGRPVRIGERWVVPTFHPSHVIRLPDEGRRRVALERIVEALRCAAALADGQASLTDVSPVRG